jgi:hypothetical protein
MADVQSTTNSDQSMQNQLDAITQQGNANTVADAQKQEAQAEFQKEANLVRTAIQQSVG